MACQISSMSKISQVLFWMRELYLACIAFFNLGQLEQHIACLSVLNLLFLLLPMLYYNILNICTMCIYDSTMRVLINCVKQEGVPKIARSWFGWLELSNISLDIGAEPKFI